MFRFSLHRTVVGLLLAGLVFSLTLPAAADWPTGPRPSRAEAPVPKSEPIPRLKAFANDPADDTFGTGTVQLDLQRLSVQAAGGELVIDLDFFGSVSEPDSGAPDALYGYLDLDLDQAGSTGDFPWTDLLRGDDGETGMGNEAYVDFFSFDSGQVEVIDDPSETVLGLATLVVSGSTATVRIPLALLGGDQTVDVAAAIGTLAETTDVAPNQGSVASQSDGLLLQNDRFRVEVNWADFSGNQGVGKVVEQSTDSALLYFFSPANWELLVKVLDGCAINQRYWVFVAAATNVEFSVSVTDLNTGQQYIYFNPPRQVAQTLTDTRAFATCP
ncbi:MAG: hypothetical protein SX243_13125 [Acidobacteriota bacterium]|nr:hypothetical protein [Acidobacteriota bacterium]